MKTAVKGLALAVVGISALALYLVGFNEIVLMFGAGCCGHVGAECETLVGGYEYPGASTRAIWWRPRIADECSGRHRGRCSVQPNAPVLYVLQDWRGVVRERLCAPRF